MRIRALSFLAVGAAAVVALATPAAAQDEYSPEVLSTQIAFCTENNLVVTVDGAQPGSDVHIQVDWDNDTIIDIDVIVQADGTGSVNESYPMPDVTAEFTVYVSGVIQPDPNDPDTFPFQRAIPGDRTECPDLPNTGGSALPIGQTAMFVTLAGALLAVVAIRRRSRDDADATA